MITIEFSCVDVLPKVALDERGPISARFIAWGLKDTVEVATYLRDMPYGINESSEDSMIIFEDRFGTCNTKHGIFVRLMEEYDLPIVRYEGFYPLTDKIVTGTNAILAEYSIPYIPRAHCFLKFEDYFVDLTEGNCNGKNGLICDYFEILPVSADQTKDEYYAMYDQFYDGVIAENPQFAALGLDKMWECYRRCGELNASLCPIPELN